MTRTEAYNKIAAAAENAGFTARIEPCKVWIDDARRDVNITVWENAKFRIEEKRVDVTFEFQASIATMGGNPTPEELIESAERIRAAAELVRELTGMELEYREEI